MWAKAKSCLTCSSEPSADQQQKSAGMGSASSKPADSAQQSPPTASAAAPNAPSPADSSNPQVQEQTGRQDVNLSEEGPAAAGGKAQRALDAVKNKPETSTDPDAGATVPPTAHATARMHL